MNDTIVAVATSLANSAINIIRLSGRDAIAIANKIVKGHKLDEVKANNIIYQHIINGSEIVDEVLISIFKAPKSFTTEDVVEINCHGGVFVTNKILEMLLENGARLANPGEFTQRAFFNGRIDLTQAEAVMDVIEASTEASLKIANQGLRGDIKNLIVQFRERLIDIITKIEVNIDYPEYEDEEQITEFVLKPIIEKLIIDIEDILNRSKSTLIIKNGLNTAIVGKPNVGKSSLLNALLREDRAIVTNIAGTTRDTIEARVNLGGLVLNLIDTAGLRDTEDVVERIGVEKSKKAIDQADLVLLLLDYSRPLEEEDLKLLELTNNKQRLIIVNKKDLNRNIELGSVKDCFAMSTNNEKDIVKLEKEIKELCQVVDIENNPGLANIRQIDLLKKAHNSLKDALSSLNKGTPIDLVNIDLTSSWEALGQIIGASASDNIINNLFSRFCLGK